MGFTVGLYFEDKIINNALNLYLKCWEIIYSVSRIITNHTNLKLNKMHVLYLNKNSNNYVIRLELSKRRMINNIIYCNYRHF